MDLSVKVYCTSCHREWVLRLTKAVGEDEIRKNGICSYCDARGNLVFSSSIGRK